MIELQQVSKIFNQGRPNQFQALYAVHLTLEAGGITIFQGPSGCGKTTLLSLIGAMARPSSGRITLHGRLLSNLPERFLTEVRRSTFGFVFQQFHLLRGLSVLENVLLPAYPLGRPYRELLGEAEALLRQFGIEHKAHSKVEWLSGGEAQRTALARALINHPEVIIADEPTAHLDRARAREVLVLLGELAAQGRSILISSHDPLVLETLPIKRRITLQDGHIIADEPC